MRKAILCLILVILAVSCLFIPAYSQAAALAAATSTYRGDINEDGKVDVFDLLELLKSLAGQNNTERKRQIADVNASGGVDVFDLLGLLKVLAGAEKPGVINWGPVISGFNGEGASPGDTLVVYTENVDAGITPAQVKALVEGAVTPVVSFTTDSALVLIPASFSGGNLSIVFGSDTTNSVYLRLLVKVIGKVESIAGVDLTSLTVVSIQAEDKVSSNGSFDARLNDSTEATFVVATNASGAPVLLSFLTNLTGTGLAGVKEKEGFTRLAASDNLSLGVQSTALSLVLLNPALLGSSAQERKTFAERAMLHSRFQELVSQISAVLASGVNTSYLVDDSHPEIFQLANEIAVAVYDGMEQEGLLHLAAVPSRPDPGVQAGSGGSLEFTNPYYVYYGTGLYTYGSSQPSSVFIQNPRPYRWSFVPYTGSYGITSQSLSTGGTLTAVVSKGFDFSDPNWYNWNYPQGKGTIYNSGKILLDLVDLVIKVPSLEEKLGLVVESIQDGYDVNDIRHGIETHNGREVLTGFLKIFKSKSETIIYKLWQSTLSGKMTDEAIEKSLNKMQNCVALVHSVTGNVIKVLTVVEKVPFYVDLFSAPNEVSQNFVFQYGQISYMYSLSGKVLADGVGLSGVTIRLSPGGANSTTTTGADGSYAFSGLTSGVYTITPSKTGYSFSPPSSKVSVGTSDAVADDITAVTTDDYSTKLTFGTSNGQAVSWKVRKTLTGGTKNNPGPNYWSASSDNVRVDPATGYLHLKITQSGGKWYCAELESEQSFGYGTYVFQVVTRPEDLDLNAVAGLFTYREASDRVHELDIEFSRWGGQSYNTQFVVQPGSTVGNLDTFNIALNTVDAASQVYQFDWKPDSVTFTGSLASGQVLRQFKYKGNQAGSNDTPVAGGEKVLINFWLLDGEPKTSGTKEFIVKSFKFIPPWSVTGKVVMADGSGLLGVSLLISGAGVSNTSTTGTSGAFSFSGLANGTYTVTPNKSGYTFSPASQTATVNNSNATLGDFTAVANSYNVSGSVLSGGSGLSGVSVRLTGGSKDTTSTTGMNGSYLFSGIVNGTYTITPSKTSYTFSPSSLSVTVNNANVTASGFTASLVIINPTLAAYELSPASVTVAPGGSFTARYQINNPNSASMQLKLDLRYRTSAGVYDEFEPKDTTLTIQPGTAWYERVCRVPSSLGSGALNVAWYMLKTDNTQITATSYISSMVTIEKPLVPGDTTVVQGITFVAIPGGTFQMGSTTGRSNEQPVHQVTVSAFQMGRYEITQSQYQAVVNSSPLSLTGDLNLPVDRISWYDAVIFCNKLSKLAGLDSCYNLSTWACDFTKSGYRLPTEAEWEYACRAGTTTIYYTGDTESDLAKAGWYYSNSGNTTHAVGGKQANAFGLYDMHGNVWEWCNDWYGSYDSVNETDPQGPASGTHRIIRGGSWNDWYGDSPSANRTGLSPSVSDGYYPFNRGVNLGFRLVRR